MASETPTKILQENQTLDQINATEFKCFLNQHTQIKKLNLFLKAIGQSETVDETGLCGGFTTSLLAADTHNGELGLVKHLLLRKFISETHDEIIQKMGDWYKSKLEAIQKKEAQVDLQKKLKENPEQAKSIRKEHYEHIDKTICEDPQFISDFASLGSSQEVLDIINRIYNFANVVVTAQCNKQRINFIIQDEHEDDENFITIDRRIWQSDTTQFINEILKPISDGPVDEKQKEEKNISQIKNAFLFMFNLTQAELACVLEEALREGDRIYFSSAATRDKGHAVYVRVVRNSAGFLEYQLFDSNYDKRFYRSFNSCVDLTRILKRDLFSGKTNSYLPINFNVVETQEYSDRPTVKTVLNNLFLRRSNQPNINQKSYDGTSALAVAAAYGNIAIVNYLLKKGAHVDPRSLSCATNIHIYNKLKSKQSFFRRNWRYMLGAALIGGICATGIGAALVGISVGVFAFTLIGITVGTIIAKFRRDTQEGGFRFFNQAIKITKKQVPDSSRLVIDIQPTSKIAPVAKITAEMKKPDDDEFKNISIATISNIQQVRTAIDDLKNIFIMLPHKINLTDYQKKAAKSLVIFILLLRQDLANYSTKNSARINLIKDILQFAIAAYKNIVTAPSESAANNFIQDFRDDALRITNKMRNAKNGLFADPLFTHIHVAVHGCVYTLSKSSRPAVNTSEINSPSI